MDYIEIRLASDDEQAVQHLAARLRATFPEMRFQRTRIGRDGDWLCYGTYDAGAARVSGGARFDARRVAVWLEDYDLIIRPMLSVRRKPGTAIALLDDALHNLRRWLAI